MRDLFLLSFLPVLLYLILRKPFVGAVLWIWTSLLVPNAWVWGIATGLRYNLIIAVAAFVSYFLHREKARIAWSRLATLTLLFYIWFSLSAALALTETDVPFRWWDTFTRIVVFFVFCQLVLVKKLHIDTFLWVMLLAVGGYGMLEGTKYVLSGTAHLLVGIPGGSLLDRNALSIAFCSMIPIAVYLRSQTKVIFIRHGLVAMMFLLPIAVIGTLSRAGLITLVATAAIYLFTSGRRFVPVAIAIGVLALGASYVITDSYLDRVDTIREADQDTSFMGRVAAWKLSTYIALDRPLIGGGPFAVQTRDVWPRYYERYDPNQWIQTGPFENAARAAHSIYFQVLGDTGFVGFAIYMSMLLSALLTARRIMRHGRDRGDPDLSALGRALLIALVVYMIGGASLSIAYLEFLFGLLAVIAVAGARFTAAARAPEVVTSRPLRHASR